MVAGDRLANPEYARTLAELAEGGPEVFYTGRIAREAFLAGYGVTQAMPGPLFTFAAYVGAASGPAPNGIAGAALALGAIFLPSALLVVGVLPFWQSLRAARVVIDIGVHCGFEAPQEVGGGEWTYDKAWQFLTDHANQGEAWLRFELNRYLGWPGQAPSYKIGERLWLALREEVREREGEVFDLKTFHRKALDLGGVPLDTLRAAVLEEL